MRSAAPAARGSGWDDRARRARSAARARPRRRGLAAQHASPAGVQLPRDFRRDAIAEPVERRPIERIRRDGCGRVRLESRPFTERGGGRHGIANSIQIRQPPRAKWPRAAAVSPRARTARPSVTRVKAAARTLPVPTSCPTRAFQQCLGVEPRRLAPTAAGRALLFRFGLAIRLGREPARVLPHARRATVPRPACSTARRGRRERARFQLARPVAPGLSRRAAAPGSARPARPGDPPRPPAPRRSRRTAQLVRDRSGPCVDRERLAQRHSSSRVVTAPQLELAETVCNATAASPTIRGTATSPARLDTAPQRAKNLRETRETGELTRFAAAISSRPAPR